jgi:hypothetical protein
VLTHTDVTRTITPGANYTLIGAIEDNETGSQCHSAVFGVVEAPQAYTVDWTVDDMQQTWMVYTAAFRRRAS